jgi:poly-gamma-glutamate capsule biosynthesis protein CapA/YwtB (metallophosphatase superfamily)
VKKFLASITLCSLLLMGAVNHPVKQSPSETLTITAVGDIMLSRKVARFIKEENDAYYPFKKVSPWLESGDITFGNLESPFGRGGKPIPGKGIWFKAEPEYASVLKTVGFDVLSVANNHILDFDSEVLLENLEVIDSLGLHSIGAGRNIEEARSPVIIEKNGTKVAFLGYSDFYNIFWDWSYQRSFVAKEDLPGVAPLDLKVMEEDIKRVRDSVDMVVVSVHWGVEESPRPSAEQRQMAHALWEAGADVILGHHPHVLQGIEVKDGNVVAYSLGNFVFDQPWEDNRQSVILNLDFNMGKLSGLRLVPVYTKDGRALPAEGDKSEAILDKIVKLSGELDTVLAIRQGAAHMPDLSKVPAALTP